MLHKRLLLGILFLGLSIARISTAFGQFSPNKIPVVYDDRYNIRLKNFVGTVAGWSLGCLLPYVYSFDGEVYEKIYRNLMHDFYLDPSNFYDNPELISDDQLIQYKVYSESALGSFQDTGAIAHFWGVPSLGCFSLKTLDCALLTPMRLTVGGTLLACRLALEYGWAVNLSGLSGSYRCNNLGINPQRFNFFADIPYAINVLLSEYPDLRILLIDSNAYLYDGFIRSFDPRVTIFKGKLPHIPPVGDDAPLSHTDAVTRLNQFDFWRLHNELVDCVNGCRPHLILYKSTPDIMAGEMPDDLFFLVDTIVRRDDHVLKVAQSYNAALVFLCSGGYTLQHAEIMLQTLGNIFSCMHVR